MTRPFLPVLALCACLAAGPSIAASSGAGAGPSSLNYNPETGAFTEPLPPERGWQAFAELLKKAAPSVDTAIPLTPAQVAGHVAALIDAGRAAEALDIIGKQQAARDAAAVPGADVQLRYQQGRALAALGRHDEAMAVWRQMTTDYPELPEPWNALAIEYARRGQLQLARDALDMALVSDPSFAPALENLGHVQMRMAQESFDRARAAGASPAPAAAPAGQAAPAAAPATPTHDKTSARQAQ
ncbi:tetratricopeptide repeat protein [Castellaniella defragrans]|uniref:Tetratricopeptide (TPR) repeat protein n=1 Tax=Castellaniella defragrans TaxID=75697 RepID=A0A7W9TQF5_CASDE|nr:tetratricopeptide repeat protein [Castellaniella defragrans]KAB0609671.1 tetratricopeptide repeat protein [Castellaniella defragrans]MBB6084481.1 tetratricopeptide (TPR) repeat protein [Castellaniella defragrans]